MDEYYKLSGLITENILDGSLKIYIYEQNLKKEFESSGLKPKQFIEDCINSKQIKDKNSFNEFLYNNILYGQQKEVLIYKIATYDSDIVNPANLLRLIKRYYSYIEGFPYNKLMYRNDDFEEKDLVAIKCKRTVKNSIYDIQLIFAQKVKINGGGKKIVKNTISYIVVDCDIDNKIISIRVAPKTHICDKKNNKPILLAKRYFEKIQEMFTISVDFFNSIHKEALCNMNSALYHQIYEKMMKKKPDNIQDVVDKFSDSIVATLKINNLKEKKSVNSVFDVKDNITKMMENILIADIIYSANKDSSSESIEGVVTYLKFSDGRKISARLRGEKCRDSIYSSELFMSLRAAIDSSKKVTRLGVNWLEDDKNLRVAYDCLFIDCLNIHFYRDLNEDDYDYGLRKYNEYEYDVKESSDRISKMEVPS